MNGETPNTQKFYLKTCSLAAIATGEQARSLVELRDKLVTVDEGCIYHHFWGGRMEPQFVHPQYHNDFAVWASSRLHDHALAERLSIIDPTEFESLEALRQEVVETIERRLDDYEIILWTRKEDRFHFVRSTIIIFDSTLTITNPEELPHIIESLPPSSIFYHFIDAQTRTHEKIDDFSAWLQIFGNKYEALIQHIRGIDSYFLSLSQLKDELVKVTRYYFDERGLWRPVY